MGSREPVKRELGSPVSALAGLLKDYFFAIVGAAVVALLLRVYVVEAFRIPTDFMSPILLPGDHIFVNKLAYARLFGDRVPERGDVVVFAFANDPTKDYIKRVIGVGGDRIEIRDGVVTQNDQVVSRALGADEFEEKLGGRKYRVQWKGISPDLRKMMPVTVPVGQIFVLGDNRAKGQDSRSWGFLPADLLKGRASMIWFSAGPESDGSGKNAPLGVRWSRLLMRVE